MTDEKLKYTGKKPGQERPMVLKKLRIKFIVINMLMAACVLAFTFGVVSYLDYTTRVSSVYSELNYALKQASKPQAEQLSSTQPLRSQQAQNVSVEQNVGTDTTSSSQTDAATASSAENFVDTQTFANTATSSNTTKNNPVIGKTETRDSSVVLLSVYEIHPDGQYNVVAQYSNATIPKKTIEAANEIVLDHKDPRGFLNEFDLYYAWVASPNSEIHGSYLVAYADGSSVNGWRGLVLLLALCSLAALFVFFLINIYFSKWALRPVETSIKQQQQFTADASHELKTPLTVIIANMEILKGQPDETIGSQQQWIESTRSEAERMQVLVNDMLMLSRGETQLEKRITERVDFSDLVEGEVLQFESVAFERGVELDSDVEEGLCVCGDPERLGRMIGTLVDNACKYAGKSEGKSDSYPQVKITLKKKSSLGIYEPMAELKVFNTGDPIPAEDLPHIFTRFYRADKSRTNSKGSYGLGLAIGKDIVEEHNGKISVASSIVEGTTFTVLLPVVVTKKHDDN